MTKKVVKFYIRKKITVAEIGQVKITLGNYILKITRPNGKCCQNLVSFIVIGYYLGTYHKIEHESSFKCKCLWVILDQGNIVNSSLFPLITTFVFNGCILTLEMTQLAKGLLVVK